MTLLQSVRRRARWGAVALALSTVLVALSLLTPSDAAVTGKVGVNINIQDLRTTGAEQSSMSIVRAIEWTITNGTGANQANVCAQSTRTLASTVAEDVDFRTTASSFTNAFGVVSFSVVKFLAVQALATNTTTVTMSRPAGATGLPLFAAISDALAPIKPGGFFAFADPSAAGIAAVDGTADKVTFTNSAGATATYILIVCGLA